MSAMWDTPIVVSDALPMDPSPGEWARRYVRHGMADILEWLGQELGPKPEDQTHVFVMSDGTYASPTLCVSQECFDRLKEAQA